MAVSLALTSQVGAGTPVARLGVADCGFRSLRRGHVTLSTVYGVDRCLNGSQPMEPLWSPVVATGSNPSQIRPRQKTAETSRAVAAGCEQLPPNLDGKEGVSGSSPEEGFVKFLLTKSSRLPGWRRVRVSASTRASTAGTARDGDKSCEPSRSYRSLAP
jgi:hypothetical protein